MNSSVPDDKSLIADSSERDILTDTDLCNFELGMTVAMAYANGDFACAKYFEDRGAIITPHIIERAHELGMEPDHVFHTYALAVHERLCGSKEEVIPDAGL